MTIADLPKDLVEEFLYMLPVKLLLRCRCVCKAWRATIDDPSFIAKHFNRATFNKNECLLVKRFVKQHSRNVLSFVSKETLDFVSTDIDVPFFQHQHTRVFGPCNGIICLGHDGDIVLCNPATREFKALPPLIDDDLPGLMQSELGFGFGFDEKNNDYKVVRIINIYYYTPYGGRGHTVKAEIYNLSSNSWRKLDARLPKVWFTLCFELLFNGVFHWYAQNSCDNSRYELILSFHMSTEVFKEIHFPDTCYWNKRRSLGVLNNESLALILFEDYNQAHKNFEIWVMKEYGVKESWTKQFTVGPLLGIHSPLSFGKHNELLLQSDNGQLVSCDLNTNKIRDFEVCGAPTSLGAVMYVESLFSLKRAG
ncbi:hypothetical protein LguiB_028309 [Lonicera macranthoides]